MRVCSEEHKLDCLIQLGTRLPKSDPCHAQCANYPNPAKSPVGHTEELWATATAALMQATAPDALLPSMSSTRDQSVSPVTLFYLLSDSSLFFFCMFMSQSGDAPFRLSPPGHSRCGRQSELAKTRRVNPLRGEGETFPKISRGALM